MFEQFKPAHAGHANISYQTGGGGPMWRLQKIFRTGEPLRAKAPGCEQVYETLPDRFVIVYDRNHRHWCRRPLYAKGLVTKVEEQSAPEAIALFAD